MSERDEEIMEQNYTVIASRLSEPMIWSLHNVALWPGSATPSGTTSTFAALVRRELITPGARHYLTDLGREVHRELYARVQSSTAEYGYVRIYGSDRNFPLATYQVGKKELRTLRDWELETAWDEAAEMNARPYVPATEMGLSWVSDARTGRRVSRKFYGSRTAEDAQVADRWNNGDQCWPRIHGMEEGMPIFVAYVDVKATENEADGLWCIHRTTNRFGETDEDRAMSYTSTTLLGGVDNARKAVLDTIRSEQVGFREHQYCVDRLEAIARLFEIEPLARRVVCDGLVFEFRQIGAALPQDNMQIMVDEVVHEMRVVHTAGETTTDAEDEEGDETFTCPDCGLPWPVTEREDHRDDCVLVDNSGDLAPYDVAVR